MSQFKNNNLLHNLRVGIRMVEEGMHPKVAALAMKMEGINMPEQLITAASEPGVMDSISAKPFTHKRADAQIAANRSMKKNLDRASEQAEQKENITVDAAN